MTSADVHRHHRDRPGTSGTGDADGPLPFQPLAHALRPPLEADESATLAAGHLAAVLGADTVVVGIVDTDGRVALLAAHDAPASLTARFPEAVVSGSPSSEAVRYGQPLFIESARERAERYADDDSLGGHDAAAFVPVERLDGTTVGLIGAYFATSHAFSTSERDILCTAAELLGRSWDDHPAIATTGAPTAVSVAPPRTRPNAALGPRPSHGARRRQPWRRAAPAPVLPDGGRQPVARWRIGLDCLIGLAAPLLLLGLFEILGDSSQIRPGAAFVACVALVAVGVGVRAAIAAGCSAVMVFWYRMVGSWALPSGDAALSLALFAVAIATIVVLVGRLARARQRLADDDALARQFIDRLPIGVAITDRDATFRFANPRIAAINRVDVADHLGRHVAEILPASQVASIEALVQRVIETGEPLLDMSITGYRDDGEFAAARASYLPLELPGRGVVAVATVVEDITAERAARVRSAVLTHAAQRLATATTAEDVADVITAMCVPTIAHRAAVVLRDADRRTLRMASFVGYPAEVTAHWPRAAVPFAAGHPVADCILRNDAVFVAGPDEFAARYPEFEDDRARTGTQAAAFVPIASPAGDGVPEGVLLLAWDETHTASDEERSLLFTLATLAAQALDRILTVEAHSQVRFREALDAMLDGVTIADAVRDEQGTVVDFVIRHANAARIDGADRTAADLVGRRASELYPGWKDSGLFDRFVEVVETGRPLVEDELEYHDVVDGIPYTTVMDLQIVRFGDGYLGASRDVTEQVQLRRQVAAAAEHTAREQVAVELLQKVALPEALPEVPGLRMAAAYLPATTRSPVGGDWYDAFEIGDDRVGIVVGDVAGHGAEAATDMIRARNLVQAYALSGAPPAEVLRLANLGLQRIWDGTNFATCMYLLVDLDTRTARWASAGHPPALWLRAGGVEQLRAPTGPVLGVIADARYEHHHVTLDAGDTVVVFTDGLVEAADVPIDDGIAHLAAHLSGQHGSPPGRIRQVIVDDLVPADRADDICVIALALDGRSGPELDG